MKRYVITCDRCGEEIRNETGRTVISTNAPLVLPGRMNSVSEFDLCSDCGVEFGHYMTNKTVHGRRA